MNKLSMLYARSGVALGALTLAFGGAGKVFAEATGPFSASNTIALPSNTGFSSDVNAQNLISTLGNQALNIIMLLAGIIAVFYLIFSGFQYVTSAGNPEKVKTARQGIINAIIGIVIIMSAFFIVRFATSIGKTVDQSAGTPTP